MRGVVVDKNVNGQNNLSNNNKELGSNNKKLMFNTSLDKNVNETYIKHWNKKFIDNPEKKDRTTQMKKYMDQDRLEMFRRNCFKSQKHRVKNTGKTNLEFIQKITKRV